MKRPAGGVDSKQFEFRLRCQPWRPPFRLRAGDVIRFNGRLGYVLRVNDCAAVILVNRPVRVFTTRFDQPVRFQPAPARFRISPQSEVPILNRKVR